MRFVFLATGSRGDVQPYLALCRALQDSGHHVRLAAAAIFQVLADAHNISNFALQIEPKAAMESEMAKFFINSGRNPLG